MDFPEMFFLVTLTVYYIVQVLLISDNGGPFESETKSVVLQYGSPNGLKSMTYRVGLFDYIRRIFRVYDIEGNSWRVRTTSVNLWICSKCLSVWVSFSVYFILFLLSNDPEFLIYVLPTAGLITYLDTE